MQPHCAVWAYSVKLKKRMANTDVKIYLTHNRMILTNNLGFRFEFPIPLPGNVIIVHLGEQTFRINLTLPDAPDSPSPNVSSDDPDESSAPSTPSNEGGGAGSPPPKLKPTAQWCK